MDEDVKYTQNDDGSRSFTLTLTQDQLNSDQFLNNMKDGGDLLKSWESQKSMIGRNNIPNAEATEEEWAKVYEKARPADGKYGLDNENLEKFANENGLNKHQAAKLATYVKDLTAVPAEETSQEALATKLTAALGEKMPEKVTLINAVMQECWTEEEDNAFNEMPNSKKVLVAKLIDNILSKYSVKGADFKVGTGGIAPTAGKADRSGYEAERLEIAKAGKNLTDIEDRKLREKYGIKYIDVKAGLGF